MKFDYVSLAGCAGVRGTVVVIDVIRAFTTAAYAFAGGAREILLTRAVDEALTLRQQFPQALVMGEVGGLKPEEFDFGNSPAELAAADVRGRTLIQRTTAGTQGAVLSAHAGLLLAGSFAVAAATAAFLRRRKPKRVTFVVTGARSDESFTGRPILQGDEDCACADYLRALLLASPDGEQSDARPFLERVRHAPTANKFLDPEQAEFAAVDLDYCTRLDAFNFAMQVSRNSRLLALNPVSV